MNQSESSSVSNQSKSPETPVVPLVPKDARKQRPNSLKVRVSVNNHIEWFYNMFASIGINRIITSRTSTGQITKGYIRSWRLLLFILLRLNLAAKTVFLLYLISPYNEEELDVSTCCGIGIWLALSGVAVYSDYYFIQIFPSFELFCAFWTVQSDIYAKLSNGLKEDYRKTSNETAKKHTKFHTYATLFAMCGLTVQFSMDPNGITFTGSLIGSENVFIQFLLFIHEQVFMISTWYQAVSTILIPVLVGKELKVALDFLSEELKLQYEIKRNKGRLTKGNKEDEKLTVEDTTGEFYTIETILNEYQRLEIISDRLIYVNSFILLITQIIYFALITTDVYTGIQFLRVGDLLAVAFYFADCSSGMVYWWYSLYAMGRLDESMQDFKATLTSYFELEYRQRREHLKMMRSFRNIDVYMGPTAVTKETPAEVIYDLFGYYILAAMW